MNLYHLRSPNFIGNTIYPISALDNIHPEIAQIAKRKYAGRESLLEIKLPVANCCISELIHLSPVDIKMVINALRMVSFTSPTLHAKFQHLRDMKYFQIPIGRFDTKKLYVLKIDKAIGDDLELFKKVIRSNLYSWAEGSTFLNSHVPEVQVKYFEECANNSSLRPYLFTGITHIFYQGSIEIEEGDIQNVIL